MANKFFLLLSVLMLYSCTTEWDPYEGKEYTQFTNQTLESGSLNLTHETIDLGGNPFKFPGIMRNANNTLIIAETKGERPYHLYDITTNTYSQGGDFGKGPYEVLSPWTMDAINSDSTFVYDIMQKKIVLYDLNTLTSNKDALWEQKILEQETITDFQVEQSKVYFTSFARDERLHCLDLKSNKITSYGKLLDKKHTNVQPQVHGQLNQAFIAKKGDVIMIIYMLAPIVEFYNMKTKEWKTFKGPDNFIPIYEEDEVEGTPLFTYTQQTTTCYYDAYASDNFFYALYDGENQEKSKGFPKCDDIYVFDLDGNYVKHYKLDVGISTFSVVDDKTIYGIHTDLVSELVKFEM